MNISISNLVTRFTQLNKWIASASLIIMMFMVAIAAISRRFGFPIVGDIEIVQITMVSLVVGSLAFTESQKGHIAIGIIVDKVPVKLQYFLDLVSGILKAVFAFLVAYVFITKMNFVQASILLRIPFYIIKILLIMGFIGWGLESIKQIFENIEFLFKKGTRNCSNE